MVTRSPDGVLVTRPSNAAGDTARRLTTMGWRPILAPMLRIESVAAALPEPRHVQALLVTSSATLTFIPPAFHSTQLLAVGDATAERARRAGFARVTSAGADAAALASLAAEICDPAGAPLLLAGAAGQGDVLAAALSRGGFRVLAHAVYQACPALEIPHDARLDLMAGRVAAVLFFSPATTRAFVAAFLQVCPSDIVLNIDAAAISEEAATPLTPLPWRRIRVARRPNHDELLALLP